MLGRKLNSARTLAVLFALPLLASCTESIREAPNPVRFALIGNTNPDTPYRDLSTKIRSVFYRINRENPLIVVHMGNVVYGGKKWMGINREDVKKQYYQFSSFTAALRSLLYTVKGEKDTYEDKSDVYYQFSRKNDYYSFNYGNVHFIMLDSIDTKPGTVGDDQIEWLKDDLEYYRNSPAILVFIHHPLFLPPGRYPNDAIFCRQAQVLHALFAKYPVKAVFSGNLDRYYSTRRGAIEYITAGCGGYNPSDSAKSHASYYIVDFDRGSINVAARQVPYDRMQKHRLLRFHLFPE